MSERHTATGFVGTPPRSTGSVAIPSPPFTWEQLFPTLPPDVQNTLLRTVAARGSLTAADLPDPPPPTPYADPIERWLGRFLAADPAGFPGYEPAAVGFDPRRQPGEVHALAAAVAAPDLFLVDAPPGPDRIAYVADLAAEAVRLGQRVLVLTTTPSAADTLLARWTSDPDLLVGRAVGTGLESADRLPAASLVRTAAAHGAKQVAEVRNKVAASVTETESTLGALQKADEAIASIRRARERRHQLLTTEAPCEAGPDLEMARMDERGRKVADELAAKQAELAGLEAQNAECLKRTEAKKSGVFAIVKGLFSKDDTAEKAGELQGKIASCTAEVARLKAECELVATDRTQRGSALQAEDARRLEAEAARRTAELADVDSAIQSGLATLAAAGLHIGHELNEDALEAVAGQIGVTRSKATCELAFSRTWLADLTTREPELIREFWGQVRIVVGPFAAVDHDPLTTAVPFDRLVVADAENIADDVLAAAVKHATTWVLVGEADLGPLNGRQAGHVLPRPSRNGHGYPPPRGLAFRKLWNHFHRPSWGREGNGLVARLVATDPRAELVCEPLADKPDVELRFANVRGEPQLAEVVFPPSVPAAEARAFLAKELGEVRLTPCGAVRWHETESEVTACWPAADAVICECDWADLTGGVREKVSGTGPDARSCAVVFDKAGGWDRAAAAKWLAEHLPVNRTACLPRPLVIAEPAAPRLVAGAIG